MQTLTTSTLLLLPKSFKPLNSLPTPPTTTITSTDTGLLFREKLLYLSNLNIDIHKALSLNPSLRSTPLPILRSIELTLASLGLPRPSIGRILDMHPSLLTSDPHSTLYPVLDFLLNEVHIPFQHFPKSISRCPRLLVSSVPSQLRPAYQFLVSLGFVGQNSVNSHTSLLLVYNVESTLMAKVRFLEELGFRFGEVKKMVVRSPGLLTFSVERNLVPKVEYYVEEMRGNLEELREFPQYFSFSLEKRIKPRHRKLAEFGLRMPLPMMLKVSDGEFNVRVMDLRLRRVEDW